MTAHDFTVFILLDLAEKAFALGDSETGWQHMEAAEQTLPTVTTDEIFAHACERADEVWATQMETGFRVKRGSRQLELSF